MGCSTSHSMKQTIIEGLIILGRERPTRLLTDHTRDVSDVWYVLWNDSRVSPRRQGCPVRVYPMSDGALCGS